jgi:hypothetical protein
MTFTARVHNRSIALPPDLPVAEGAEVQVTVPEPPVSAEPAEPGNTLGWMLQYAGIVDDLPADLAAEHDHYLYGTPKKGGKS